MRDQLWKGQEQISRAPLLMLNLIHGRIDVFDLFHAEGVTVGPRICLVLCDNL